MHKRDCLIALVGVNILLLASCGGGGSSSGSSAQDNNVTSCVPTSDAPNSTGILTRTYTNACGFPVNLGIGITSITRIEPLNNNQSTTAAVVGQGHIACRAPSMPFDADESALRDFRCT